MRGKYIVLEGGEHVGKTTQAFIVSDWLGAELVREPGGTQIGEGIRSLILDPSIDKTPETGVLLHAAQRSMLAKTVIAPAIEKGRHVLSDRSWVSSAAYQGVEGVPYESIYAINKFALGELIQPDLCVILDADPADVIKRSPTKVKDYYESMDIGFHVEIRERFLDIGERIGAVIINALQEPEAVTQQIVEVIQDKLTI